MGGRSSREVNKLIHNTTTNEINTLLLKCREFKNYYDQYHEEIVREFGDKALGGGVIADGSITAPGSNVVWAL